MSGLSTEDKKAREIIDGYIKLGEEAGDSIETAVTEFVKESAYTWTNRIFTLRCMEARGLIDEVIIQKDVYGGRSLEHKRLVQKDPSLSSGEDDGLFVLFDKIFKEQYENIPDLFDPESPAILLRPSPHVLQKYIRILSGKEKINNREYVDEEIFKAQDAMGWAYQYWNAEEKDRVFEMVRTKKGAKIEGYDIIPATQLYTEPYMVKFLVQNSLGATWMQMHPESKIIDSMEYYVKDADRTPVEKKSVKEITFLDPAVGSGHFLLEAFDIYFKMYQEEGYENTKEICDSILNNNLFGIDIDERSIQITRSVLYIKASEKVYHYSGKYLNTFHDHIVATNIRLPRGKDHLELFLKKHPEDEPLKEALIAVFEGLENVHELGSLVQIEEIVERELERIKEKSTSRSFDILTGELITPINYSKWRNETLSRIKQHFKEEAEKAIPSEAFFSKSVVQGLEFFNMISIRYDIVAANPPYMGSGNMNLFLKNYLKTHYNAGKSDLYAAFILRNLELTKKSGRVAIVTQQSWMFLKSFIKLRGGKEKSITMDFSNDSGLLQMVSIETLAHLGPNAFNEISGEIVNTVMFTFSVISPSNDHNLIAYRLIGAPSQKEKNSILITAIQSKIHIDKYISLQNAFLNLPEKPLLYWLSTDLILLYEKHSLLEDYADTSDGVTGLARLTRFHWEILTNERWPIFSKGGGYSRWRGLEYYNCDWEHNGSRQKAYIDTYYPYLKGNYGFRLKKPGIFPDKAYCFSSFSAAGICCRMLEKNGIVGDKGPGIIPTSSFGRLLLSIMNTTIPNYLLRATSGIGQVQYPYVLKIPINNIIDNKNLLIIEDCQNSCISLKEDIISQNDIINRLYLPKVLKGQTFNIITFYHYYIENILTNSVLILCCEGLLEKIIINSYNISESTKIQLFHETGIPVCFHPLIIGYDKDISLPYNNSEISLSLKNFFKETLRISVSGEELIRVKKQLQLLFQAGPGGKSKYDPILSKIPNQNDTLITSAARLPRPPETFIEEISQKMNIHPISILLLLKEGIEKQDWRCIPEERRMVESQVSIHVLHMLGYQWVREGESGNSVLEQVDVDGIIPLTVGCGEETLIERVKKRFTNNIDNHTIQKFEIYFNEIFGMSLEKWLENEFFKNHIKQFRRRPIAWQIQSGPHTRIKKPAFSCLFFYHKIDHDALFKLKSHYIGPLRSRYETELRMIEKISPDARSERQAARREELAELIGELKEFDVKIEKVSAEGFDYSNLKKIIDKEPLDKWCSIDGKKPHPQSTEEFYRQEKACIPDINDGVRVNIAPLQKAGLLAADVLAKKDLEKAISDRAEWRADERRWCREGKLPKPGWWEV